MQREQQETELALALFHEQQRARGELARAEASRWLTIGSAVASVILFLLWQWRLLPGPWQWFATAQRPAELLWIPLLFALGGYWTRWSRPPSLRRAAWRLDRSHHSAETILTAADWLLSDAPRTANSARVLERALELLEAGPQPSEESRGRPPTRLKRVLLALATLLLPAVLLILFWTQDRPAVGGTHFSSRTEIERLETLLEEQLDPRQPEAQDGQRLQRLLEKLEKEALPADPAEREALLLEAERARSKERALRDLLESLAERVGRGEALSDSEKKALKTGAAAAPDFAEVLTRTEQSWSEGRHSQARRELQRAQAQSGQRARALEEAGRSLRESTEQRERSAAAERREPGPPNSGEGGEGGESGDRFAHSGQGQTSPRGTEPGKADFGVGTSDAESKKEGGTSGQLSQRRSDRTSEWEEQFRRLHAAQEATRSTERTRVLGEIDESGQLYDSSESAVGAASTDPRYRPGDAVLEARQAAENALLKERVPPQRADAVRRYFEPR